MWISTTELDLLNKVFDQKEIVPKNRKNGLKLRHISFFMSNMKAITNVCKSLEKIAMGESLPHQYVEVLRKMGLINKNEELTRYGKGLFKIIYFDNNRIADEINDPSKTTVEALSEDISYKIEFYLFATVYRLLNDKEECLRCNIDQSDLAKESMDNIEYFINNVIDTLKEPSNKLGNVLELFDFDNDDFYYTIQGMNFSGYEIKRLLRLNKDEIDTTWKTYKRLLDSVKRTHESSLTADEQRFYEYAKYYADLVQKDVRKRVKHSVFNYILLESIHESRHRIKIIENEEFAKVMDYDFIREKYNEYHLKDIYDLVFFENDSRYITDIIKPFPIDYSIIKDIDKNNEFCVVESDIRKNHINLEDKVIFTDVSLSKILKMYVYAIQRLKKNTTKVDVKVEKKNQINSDKENDILDEFKG